MRFDFTEPERVFEALDRGRDQSRDRNPASTGDRRYRAAVETALPSFPDGLERLSCRVIDRSDDGEPVHRFGVTPVMTTPLVHTFDLPLSRVRTYDHRVRVLGVGHGRTPTAALRSLRRRGLVVQLELRRGTGEFEPLLWATDTQVYMEGVSGYDIHREPDVVDKGVQARLLSRGEEFVRVDEASDRNDAEG
jgi:hypothetical protein